jgi:hypothetical protein
MTSLLQDAEEEDDEEQVGESERMERDEVGSPISSSSRILFPSSTSMLVESGSAEIAVGAIVTVEKVSFDLDECRERKTGRGV